MLLMTDRRTIYLNLAFFAVLILVYLALNFRGSVSGPEQIVSFESAGLERTLTPLTAQTKPRSIKDYRGAPILLHFWASWCEPCTRDEKKLQELFTAAAGSGARFVAVASEDRPEAIRRAGKLQAYPGDVFVDPSGELAQAFSVKAYPYTILIDRDGHLLFRSEGPLANEDLQRLKETLSSQAALPSFQFENAAGGTVSSASLAEKIWVADFVFTSCGDTCPMISEKLRAVQEEFGKNPAFRIVSFSVDPGRDTPERLRDFGRKHAADPALWFFLRPPLEALHELMAKGFHLGTLENPLAHTAKLVVVRKGNVVDDYIDGDAPDAVPRLKAKLSALLGPG